MSTSSSARPPPRATQVIVGNLHVQAGFLGDQAVQVAQGAATGQHDAALGDVGAQFRRSAQRQLHRADDARQRFVQGLEHLVGADLIIFGTPSARLRPEISISITSACG